MKVSLRASADEVDVSVIARKEGGGGHRQAAGFSTSAACDELIEFLRRPRSQAAAARTAVDGVLLVRSRRGSPRTTSSLRCGARRRSRKAKVGHAGTLDPFATGLLLVLVGQATRLQRYLVGLPKAYRVRARFGATSDTGDPTGELHRRPASGRRGRDPAALAPLTGEIEQRVPAYSAVKVGGRAALPQGPRAVRRSSAPSGPCGSSRLELIGFDEAGAGGRAGGGVLERHLRAPARGRPRRAVRRRAPTAPRSSARGGPVRAGGCRPGTDAAAVRGARVPAGAPADRGGGRRGAPRAPRRRTTGRGEDLCA